MFDQMLGKNIVKAGVREWERVADIQVNCLMLFGKDIRVQPPGYHFAGTSEMQFVNRVGAKITCNLHAPAVNQIPVAPAPGERSRPALQAGSNKLDGIQPVNGGSV